MIGSTSKTSGLVRAFAVALLLLAVSPVQAQLTTGTVRGMIEGAGAGVRVEAFDPATGFTRHVQTRSDGTYVIPGLRPRVYRIAADAPGGRFEEVVRVQIAQTPTVDLHRPLTRDLDQILAEGVAPGFEVRTSEVGTNVTAEQIEMLPQGSRDIRNLIKLAPGTRTR